MFPKLECNKNIPVSLGFCIWTHMPQVLDFSPELHILAPAKINKKLQSLSNQYYKASCDTCNIIYNKLHHKAGMQ